MQKTRATVDKITDSEGGPLGRPRTAMNSEVAQMYIYSGELEEILGHGYITKTDAGLDLCNLSPETIM